MAFEYTFFVTTNRKEVQDKLNALGADGWRLHSFEPLPDVLSMGIEYHVVMDRIVREEVPETPPDRPQGIACRG